MTGLQESHSNKIEAIRWLRGVAAFMVMLTHLFVIEGKYGGDDRLLPDWLLGGLSGVDLFFGISGFVMVWVTARTAPGLRSSMRFFWSRITRIYPVYWVISLALLIVWLQAPQILLSSEAKDPVLWRSFLLYPDFRPPLLPVGWTLIHEMYFYLLFTVLILLLPAKWRLGGVLAWLAIVLVAAWHFWPLHHIPPVVQVAASPLGAEFTAGALAAWGFLRWRGRGAMTALIVGSILFLFAMAASMRGGEGAGFASPWRGILFAPGLAPFLYGLVGWEARGGHFDRFFRWVGDQSYSLYLTHLLTLSVMGRIWAMFAAQGIWDNFLVIPLLVAGSLLVGWLSYRLVELPAIHWSHKWRNRLFG